MQDPDILMTGSPSNFTSFDQLLKYSFPVLFDVIRPFLAAHPASVPDVLTSPTCFLMFTVLPPMMTVPVPFSVSEPCRSSDRAPARRAGWPGSAGGVKQTSGKAAIDLAVCCLAGDLQSVGEDAAHRTRSTAAPAARAGAVVGGCLDQDAGRRRIALRGRRSGHPDHQRDGGGADVAEALGRTPEVLERRAAAQQAGATARAVCLNQILLADQVARCGSRSARISRPASARPPR